MEASKKKEIDFNIGSAMFFCVLNKFFGEFWDMEKGFSLHMRKYTREDIHLFTRREVVLSS